jgi:arabinan endo-1,5-alpha-L-arabinosidase
MLRPIKKLFLSLLLVVFLASVAHANLTHRYSFTNGDSGAVDSVGGSNGTLVNGAYISNNAVQLDGVNDYVNLPGAAIAINTFPAITLEMWSTQPTTNQSYSMTAAFGNTWSNGNGRDYLMIATTRGDNVSRGAIANTPDNSSPWLDEVGVNGPELNDGLEHQYVLTVSNTEIIYYIDGVPQSNASMGTTTISGLSNQYVYLGRSLYTGDARVNCSINEFRIYNSILTPGEIAQHYSNGPDITGPSPIVIQETDGSTEVTEGNSTPDTYTIALSSQPAANVNLTVDPDEQLDIGSGRGNSVILLFTPQDWNTPQTVTVRAFDDDVLETDPHIGLIAHSISSSDPNFNNKPLPSVGVIIWDNECGPWGFNYSDLNYDCQVNFKDLAILALDWLSVFGNDYLEVLSSEWLETTRPYAAGAQQGPIGDDGYERLTGDYYSHDPVMMRQGNTYYSFCTGVQTPIRTSTDMHNWQYLGDVWPSGPPAWTWTISGFDGNIWAPDISYFNSKYHLYYAISSFGSRNSCIGLATRTTLGSGGWTDRGQVICTTESDNYNAIDPALFIDTNSTPTTYWLAFGSFWDGIKMRQIDPNTGLLLASNLTLYSLAYNPNPSDPNEHPIEAAFLVYKEPYYYLFVSYDYCCQGTDSTYNVRVGRATSVTGPYYDRNGTPMLNGGGTQLTWSTDQWKGPGHQAVVLNDNGKDWLLHHAYIVPSGTAYLRIRRLFWTPDGWPTLIP